MGNKAQNKIFLVAEHIFFYFFTSCDSISIEFAFAKKQILQPICLHVRSLKTCKDHSPLCSSFGTARTTVSRSLPARYFSMNKSSVFFGMQGSISRLDSGLRLSLTVNLEELKMRGVKLSLTFLNHTSRECLPFKGTTCPCFHSCKKNLGNVFFQNGLEETKEEMVDSPPTTQSNSLTAA